MYDLEKLIKANTTEGVIDYQKVMATLDSEYVNPIVAKKTDESKLLPKAVEKVVKELGIEGESIDDIKLYVKKMGGSTDEFKETNLKLEKTIKELEQKYQAELEARNKLESDFEDKKRTDLIKGLGVTDEKTIKFLKWDLSQQVTEEKPFDVVVQEYAKENEITTTAKFIKDEFGNGNTEKGIDITEAFKKLYK